ncbi:Hyaluronidase [Eumeta japonica]|uniref:Hyaluronidase n=1 Tax=Eumeta variegata TaxID=151549 RepID=A0A4C1SN75_EUMVA|nr:Hyaluronidase [Eumeta japonica]
MQIAQKTVYNFHPSVSGVGIIDFESWRPIYRQNFGVLTPYKDVSYEIERKRHWWWTKSWIQAEAIARFEKAGKEFMQKTLTLAKKLRPNALWGYYAYPYCFNMAGNHFDESCAKNVPQENDRLSWLWSASTALYPSVYSSKSLTTQQLQQLIRGRIKEALRINVNKLPILPYFWFKYRDGGFLSQKHLEAALQTLYRSSASGIIIWGSSNDVNTKVKCQNLLSYLNDTLGPSISKYTKRNKVPLYDEVDGLEIDDIINNDDSTTTINPNPTGSVLDPEIDWNPPEIDWNPPENDTQNIVQAVQNVLDLDANLTSNKDQLNIESTTLDRRKSEENSLDSLNSTKVQVENKEKDTLNTLHKDSNAYVIDENKLSSNIHYNYLSNNSLNCSTLNGIVDINFCDNYSDGSNKSIKVLKLDIDTNQIIVTTEDTTGSIENDLSFKTVISSQQTDSSTVFVDTSPNISFVSENSSSKTLSAEDQETSDNLIQNENENTLINEYSVLHKDEKKGNAIINRVKDIQNTINNEKDTHYLPVHYTTTLADGEVLDQNNLNTEIDETSFSTTEQYLGHKNNLRHSKNKKKGRRRHLTYHTTEITTPQDAIIDSKTVVQSSTTDVASNNLPINESTRPPQAYQQIEAMNVEKDYNNMESDINEETDETQASKYLNHVKTKLKLTTNSEIIINPDFTTEQVIVYEVLQE